MAIFIAGIAAILGVPRAVPPSEVPAPTVRGAELDAVIAADEDRAHALLPLGPGRPPAKVLDHDVRLLGQAICAFGRAASEESLPELEKTHAEVVRAAEVAIARSPEEVLALRAYQTHEVIRELRAFERTGEPTEKLKELSGWLIQSLELYQWYDRPSRRLLPDEAALRAMYKKRWNELTNLTGTAFALSLDEERALLRFLIAHPAVERSARSVAITSPQARTARELADAVALQKARLKKVRELAKIDPSYPAAFAEGVVLFQLGQFEEAASAFERHLAAHPDGPFTLRARNHLKAALEAR